MLADARDIAAAEFAEVRASARANDFDRYLAALLNPRAVRQDLVALAAALGEIARVPSLVKEPMMGEVRLIWWRDWLMKPPGEGRSGNPVADAMRDCVARHALSRELVAGIAESRIAELYADPVRDWAELEAFAERTEGAGLALAAGIVGAGAAAAEEAVCAAGRALGLTRVLLALPRDHARGRDPLPPVVGTTTVERIAMTALRARTAAQEASRAVATSASPKLAAALLPVALVEPYLQALQKPGHDPVAALTELSPFTRVWRLWRAHVMGRL